MNVWLWSVSASRRGCSPLVATDSSECEGEQTNTDVTILLLRYKTELTGREENLISPLKTTLELWLSQMALSPDALVIILLSTVSGANSKKKESSQNLG